LALHIHLMFFHRTMCLDSSPFLLSFYPPI
jgi:hypothetical protein